MDGQKNLNKKKFFNKNKYKNPKYAQKHTVVESDKSKGIELLKNWNRYEEPEGEGEVDEESRLYGKDYKVISERPITQGSSFHFKSDKFLLPNVDREQSLDDIFKIDLSLLEMGLETIPFHERFDIDSRIFKGKDISAMEDNAEKAYIIYETALKDKFTIPVGVQDKFSKSDSAKHTFSKSGAQDTLPKAPTGTTIESNQVSSSSDEETVNEEVPTLKHNKDAVVQDLEDWLDDILN